MSEFKEYDDWEASLDQNYLDQLRPDAFELSPDAFYAGQQSQQAKIDELQARVDEVLIEMKNQLGDEDFCDMQRPDYDAMLYALRNIKDILKGKKDDRR